MTGKRRSNWIDPIVKRLAPPTAKELRAFGVTLGLFVAGGLGLLFPLLWNLPFVVWPWVVGGLFLLWALIAPITLTPIFYLWMVFAGALGWVNTRLILALVNYLVFFQNKNLMRLSGCDPLRRTRKDDIISYRIRSKAADRKQMEKPF